MATFRRVEPNNWEIVDNIAKLSKEPYRRVRRRGFPNKTSAERWFKNEQVLYANGESEYNKKEPSKDMTVRELYDLWIVYYETIKKPEQSTLSKVWQYYDNQILPEWGDYQLRDLTSLRIENYVIELSRKFKQQSRHVTTYFKTMLTYATKHEILDRNPFDGVTLPSKNQRKDVNKSADSLEPDEFKSWLHTLDNDRGKTHFQTYTGLRLLANTGMRPSELAGLQWGDVDFKAGSISIRRAIGRGIGTYVKSTKTKSGERTLTLDAITFGVLKEWYEQTAYQGKADFIFTGKNGRYVSATRPNEWVKKFAKSHGFSSKIVAYTFRHTFATLGLESGISPKALAEWLGHMDTQMLFNTYSRTTQNQRSKTIEFINAFQ